MLKPLMYVAALLAVGIGFRAAALSLEEFVPATEQDAAALLPPENVDLKLVRNGDFENGADGWSGGAVVDRCGVNQTQGLRYTRHDDSYQSIAQPVLLKPGRRYLFGAMVRTEDVTGEGAGVYLEGYGLGQYLGGTYSTPVAGTKDWSRIECEYTAPADRPDALHTLALYMRRGSQGEAYFDDVFLREAIPLWQIAPVYPSHGRLYRGKPLIFSSYFNGLNPADYPDTAILLQIGDQPATEFPAGNGTLELHPGPLPDGEVAIRCAWVDKKAKRIISEKDFTLQNSNPPAVPANAAMLDPRHRLHVDNRLFLPLGLYTQQLSRQDIDTIAASDFNCVLPYPSAELRFPDSKQTGIAAIREVLNYCQAKGVKVIFSLKDIYPGFKSPWAGEVDADEFVTRLVQGLKDHPALLAWYICDEFSPDRIPEVTARRKLVNRLDPYHPTYAVYYQMPDYEYYIPAQDVFGNDPYPINLREDDNIELVDKSSAKAEQLNMPLWPVPQIAHIGFYSTKWYEDPTDYFVKLRPPSEEEMQSMCLLEMMRGATGLVMYSYFDLTLGPDPLQFERRWPEVCRVAARLNALKPYFLSDGDGPATKVTVRQGKAYARCFALPDGSLALVVVAPGPGRTDAEIVVGDGVTGLKAGNGRTFEVRPGVYRFNCSDVGYDILRNR